MPRSSSRRPSGPTTRRDSSGQSSTAAGSAEIGCNIARPLWGRGLATEAAAAVIAFGFHELGLARVQASTDIRNTASWRVMEKLGMAREGVARENRLLKDERVDDVLYAVLRGEWQARERSRES